MSEKQQIYYSMIKDTYKQNLNDIIEEKTSDFVLEVNKDKYKETIENNCQQLTNYVQLNSDNFLKSFNNYSNPFLNSSCSFSSTKDEIFVLNDKAKQLKQKGEEIYNATIGSLTDEEGKLYTFDSFYGEYDKLDNKIKSSYCQAVEGNPNFTSDIFNWLNQNGDINCCHKEIATSGGTAALSLSFNLFLDAYQEILLPITGWTNYETMAKFYNLKAVHYNIVDENNNVDLHDLMLKGLQIIKKQHKLVVVINDPCQNPTGISFKKEDWDLLIEYFNRLKEYGEVIIINDIAYIDFAYGNPYQHFSSFNKQADNVLTVLAYSCSKSVSGYGFRVGTAVILANNQKIVDEVYNAFSIATRSIYSTVNNGFMAAYHNMDKVAYQNELDGCIKLLKERSELFISEANKYDLPIYPYSGGFFITVKIDDEDLQKKYHKALLDHNIFTTNVVNGLRLSICSLDLKQSEQLPSLMASILKELD